MSTDNRTRRIFDHQIVTFWAEEQSSCTWRQIIVQRSVRFNTDEEKILTHIDQWRRPTLGLIDQHCLSLILIQEEICKWKSDHNDWWSFLWGLAVLRMTRYKLPHRHIQQSTDSTKTIGEKTDPEIEEMFVTPSLSKSIALIDLSLPCNVQYRCGWPVEEISQRRRYLSLQPVARIEPCGWNWRE